jgi:hypothetical protein
LGTQYNSTISSIAITSMVNDHNTKWHAAISVEDYLGARCWNVHQYALNTLISNCPGRRRKYCQCNPSLRTSMQSLLWKTYFRCLSTGFCFSH